MSIVRFLIVSMALLAVATSSFVVSADDTATPAIPTAAAPNQQQASNQAMPGASTNFGQQFQHGQDPSEWFMHLRWLQQQMQPMSPQAEARYGEFRQMVLRFMHDSGLIEMLQRTLSAPSRGQCCGPHHHHHGPPGPPGAWHGAHGGPGYPGMQGQPGYTSFGPSFNGAGFPGPSFNGPSMNGAPGPSINGPPGPSMNGASSGMAQNTFSQFGQSMPPMFGQQQQPQQQWVQHSKQ